MAYNGYSVSSWERRREPFVMESYGRSYNPYDALYDDGYARNGNYSRSQMRANYDTQMSYGSERFRRDQMSRRRRPRHGKRLSRESPVNEPPSKRISLSGKRLSQAGPARQPASKRKDTHGEMPPQNNAGSEPLSKRPKVGEAESRRRGDRRKRFFRARKNVRREAKGETTSSVKDENNTKCIPCSGSFKSMEEYREHLKSESHKVKSAEFYYCRKLPVGFDKDEAALDDVQTGENINVDEHTVEEGPAEETMETVKVEEKKENPSDSEDKKESKKPNPVGERCVVKVTGFYCKLCRKFFRSGYVAKKKHCSSAVHCQAYKTAMEVALKDEEERQRVQAEADVATQEAEKSAGIAAVEREVRDPPGMAESEETAAELSEQQKGDETEMSLTDGQEKSVEVEFGVQDDSSLPEKRETEVNQEKDGSTSSENKVQAEVRLKTVNDASGENAEQTEVKEEEKIDNISKQDAVDDSILNGKEQSD